jgi:acetate kinase
MLADEVEKSLNSSSGLKGVCGISDMREVLDTAGGGDERARLAVDMFCYRIKKYIGAYIAALGRVDAVVFTGGIGENSAPVRSSICRGLEHMGIIVDEGRNSAVKGNVAEIENDGARIKILVVRTDEEYEIAHQTVHSLEKSGP